MPNIGRWIIVALEGGGADMGVGMWVVGWGRDGMVRMGDRQVNSGMIGWGGAAAWAKVGRGGNDMVVEVRIGRCVVGVGCGESATEEAAIFLLVA